MEVDNQTSRRCGSIDEGKTQHQADFKGKKVRCSSREEKIYARPCCGVAEVAGKTVKLLHFTHRALP